MCSTYLQCQAPVKRFPLWCPIGEGCDASYRASQPTHFLLTSGVRPGIWEQFFGESLTDPPVLGLLRELV